jgi:hypothetical protein
MQPFADNDGSIHPTAAASGCVPIVVDTTTTANHNNNIKSFNGCFCCCFFVGIDDRIERKL